MSKSPTLSQQETLLSAYDAFGRAHRKVAGGDMSFDAVSGEIRAINRLYDAAMDCGMPHDEPSVEQWAALRVTRFLVEA